MGLPKFRDTKNETMAGYWYFSTETKLDTQSLAVLSIKSQFELYQPIRLNFSIYLGLFKVGCQCKKVKRLRKSRRMPNLVTRHHPGVPMIAHDALSHAILGWARVRITFDRDSFLKWPSISGAFFLIRQCKKLSTVDKIPRIFPLFLWSQNTFILLPLPTESLNYYSTPKHQSQIQCSKTSFHWLSPISKFTSKGKDCSYIPPQPLYIL